MKEKFSSAHDGMHNISSDCVSRIIVHDILGYMYAQRNVLMYSSKYKDDNFVLREILFELRNSTESLLRHLENVYSWTTQDEGGFEVENKEIILRYTVQEISEIFAPLFSVRNVNFSISGNENSTVYADAKCVSIILCNLLTNSLKYTENGQISVSFWKTAEGTILEVIDTGKGFAESIINAFNSDGFGRNIPNKGMYGSFIANGFGLHIVKDLCRKVDAIPVIGNRVGGGAFCRIIFKADYGDILSNKIVY